MVSLVASAGAPARLGGRPRHWLLVGPAAFALALFFLVPLGMFVIYSFLEGDDFEISWTLTLSNYAEAFTSSTVLHLIKNGLITGSLTALICVAIGLPVAYLMRFRVRRTTEYLILAGLVVSMLSSLLVRIYAWRMILGEEGILNESLRAVGLPAAGSLLFTRTAVVLALVHLFLPYMILVTYAALRNIPRDFLDLASDLGANILLTWRRVLAPLLAPSLLAGAFFIFVGASSDWVAPAFLGGTNGAMVGLAVRNQFTDFGDYPLGAAISLFVLLIFLVVYGLFALTFRLASRQRGS